MSDFDQRLRWIWWRETSAAVATPYGKTCDECLREVYVYYVHPKELLLEKKPALCRECFDKRHRPKDAPNAE